MSGDSIMSTSDALELLMDQETPSYMNGLDLGGLNWANNLLLSSAGADVNSTSNGATLDSPITWETLLNAPEGSIDWANLDLSSLGAGDLSLANISNDNASALTQIINALKSIGGTGTSGTGALSSIANLLGGSGNIADWGAALAALGKLGITGLGAKESYDAQKEQNALMRQAYEDSRADYTRNREFQDHLLTKYNEMGGGKYAAQRTGNPLGVTNA